MALALGIAAFAIRFFDLAALPYGVWFDEANNGLYAAQVLRDPTFRPISMELLQMPSHFTYFTAILFALFGGTLTTLRLSAVLPLDT